MLAAFLCYRCNVICKVACLKKYFYICSAVSDFYTVYILTKV